MKVSITTIRAELIQKHCRIGNISSYGRLPYLLERAPMLKRALPFQNQKLNERLPRISAPLFPLKGRSFETDLLLKGHSIGIRSKH